MPEIIVAAGRDGRADGAVMLRERVNADDFESERFAANLVERLGWAVIDAHEAEHEGTEQPATGSITGREKTERRATAGPRADNNETQLEPVGSA
jgi:hypothetical protein